jgi:hypothetical protein
MFVTLGIETIFNSKLTLTYVIYLHSKLHLPSSNYIQFSYNVIYAFSGDLAL